MAQTTREKVRMVLASKMQVALPKRLTPIFAQGTLTDIQAGAEVLAIPALVNCPIDVIVEIADADGPDYYRVASLNPNGQGGMLIGLNRPTSRRYQNAQVTIAGGHEPEVTQPDQIVLEEGFMPSGARFIHQVHIDYFIEIFGNQFPAVVLLMARPVLHSKLAIANAAPDPIDPATPRDRGFQKFFDACKAGGLIK